MPYRCKVEQPDALQYNGVPNLKRRCAHEERCFFFKEYLKAAPQKWKCISLRVRSSGTAFCNHTAQHYSNNNFCLSHAKYLFCWGLLDIHSKLLDAGQEPPNANCPAFDNSVPVDSVIALEKWVGT